MSVSIDAQRGVQMAEKVCYYTQSDLAWFMAAGEMSSVRSKVNTTGPYDVPVSLPAVYLIPRLYVTGGPAALLLNSKIANEVHQAASLLPPVLVVNMITALCPRAGSRSLKGTTKPPWFVIRALSALSASMAPSYSSFAELSKAYQANTTVKSVTQDYLNKIDQLNGDLKAVTVVNKRALKDAEELDVRLYLSYLLQQACWVTAILSLLNVADCNARLCRVKRGGRFLDCP